MPEIDFDAAYRVDGYDGIAWRLRGYATKIETLISDDDEFVEVEYEFVPDTENVVAVMIGDDREFTFGVDEITVIDEDSFCSTCGQIGCGHG